MCHALFLNVRLSVARSFAAALVGIVNFLWVWTPSLSAQSIEINYLGSSFDGSANETTFRYSVTALSSPGVDHFALELPTCLPPHNLVALDPSQGASLGTDSTSGIYGVKWTQPLSQNQSREYSIRLSGFVPEGSVLYGARIGHQDVSGTTTGVGCITACADPIVLDWEGFGLSRGTHVTNQLSGLGVNVSAWNNNPDHPDKAIIFDSANPTGNDADLGSPNNAFGGPGVGVGGTLTNNLGLGNILIIAEHDRDPNGDGRVDNPDDESSGGVLRFEFDSRVKILSARILDIEEVGGTITGYSDVIGGTQLFQQPIAAPGDNSLQVIDVSPLNSFENAALEVAFIGSGGLGELVLCKAPPPTPTPTSTPTVTPTSSPTATPTATPSSTPTMTATPTASPTPSVTSTPTPVITPTGTPVTVTCVETNNTGSLATIDNTFALQRRLNNRVGRALLRTSSSRSDRRFVEKALAMSSSLYEQGWALIWQVPNIALTCDNSELCASVDNTESINQVLSLSDQLRSLTKKLVRRLAVRRGAPRAFDKRARATADRLHSQNITEASNVLAVTSVCASR